MDWPSACRGRAASQSHIADGKRRLFLMRLLEPIASQLSQRTRALQSHIAVWIVCGKALERAQNRFIASFLLNVVNQHVNRFGPDSHVPVMLEDLNQALLQIIAALHASNRVQGCQAVPYVRV